MHCSKCGKDLTGLSFMFVGINVSCLTCTLLPPIPFATLTPADPGLEAIGRAFDDAIDLAYLT